MKFIVFSLFQGILLGTLRAAAGNNAATIQNDESINGRSSTLVYHDDGDIRSLGGGKSGKKSKHSYSTDEGTHPKYDHEYEMPKCRNQVLQVAQLWDGNVVTPDGSEVVFSPLQGTRFPFVGNVYDRPGGGKSSVGYSVELCERVNYNDKWLCAGTLYDVYACVGHLAFSGVFEDRTRTGKFVITGGTEDFAGATGSIFDELDDESGYYIRTIRID
ncbi:hypothetical protein ACA910_012029 [Epithemia clementina (nom. ined.)]